MQVLTPPWIQPIIDSSHTLWSQQLVQDGANTSVSTPRAKIMHGIPAQLCGLGKGISSI